MKNQNNNQVDRERLHSDFDLEIAPELSFDPFSEEPQSFPHVSRSNSPKNVKKARKIKETEEDSFF